MGKTRIAVAGAGIIGRAHIGVLRASASCALSAIVDPASPAEGAGVPHYGSLHELLAKDRPDGIILATPNHLHVPQALQCLEAGLPILLEKPISSTVAEGERLVRNVEEKKARVLIGHHRAHSPIMAKAKEIVDSGVLGRIVAVMGSATYLKPDAYFEQGPWRREAGGGPILINLIHDVHNLRMLCGEIIAVQAFASRAVRGFPVEDTAAISLSFASGALGSFMLSDTAACPRSWEQTSQENRMFASCDDEDCYVIAGANGCLSVPTMRLRTYPRAEGRSWQEPFETAVVPVIREDPLKLQLEHFGAMVRGKANPRVTARDGLANLRVTEAIVEAARLGRTVNL